MVLLETPQVWPPAPATTRAQPHRLAPLDPVSWGPAHHGLPEHLPTRLRAAPGPQAAAWTAANAGANAGGFGLSRQRGTPGSGSTAAALLPRTPCCMTQPLHRRWDTARGAAPLSSSFLESSKEAQGWVLGAGCHGHRPGRGQRLGSWLRQGSRGVGAEAEVGTPPARERHGVRLGRAGPGQG